MKKSLLALAVLTAVTGAAYAQSSVTIYGKVDLGLVLDSGSPQGKSVRLDSGVTGGSRIGFKGVEDLGGGYKASFQLETGYCADSAAGQSNTVKNSAGTTVGTVPVPNFCTGSNAFMGRQAHGDLTGAFGGLSAGRQYSLGFNNLSTIDPFGTGFAAQINNIVDPSGIRINNSVTYVTPSIAGLTAAGEIGFGEQTGNWVGGRETGAGLTYVNGPAYLGFSFYDQENANGVGSQRKNYTFGGTYDFGIVKVHGLVQKSDGDPTGAKKVDILDIMGGLTIPVGGGQLMGSYIHHNDRTANTAGGNTGDEDATQWGIGYQYPLSKRTSIYTAYAKINNDNNSFGHNAGFTVGNATAAGTGNKAFNLGVVHNF